MSQLASGPSSVATVIVPVYNGFESFARLIQSLKAHYPVPAPEWLRFDFTDDSSTDVRVMQFLQADDFFSRPDVSINRNSSNLGFVKTVNGAILRSDPDSDVVLLNSDTVIPGPVFETLLRTAGQIESVGSLTPWTNRGSITSLFNWPHGEDSFFNLSPSEMETTIRRLSLPTKNEPLPTGVGFCMLMSREAINAVGLLDEDRFGKGYGEENDWCLRASAAGFPSYLCPGTYVVHAETQSFGQEQKDELSRRNLARLETLHPGYLESVARYIEHDPLQTHRFLVLWALASAEAQKHQRRSILYALHNDPWVSLGGTEQHVLDISHLLVQSQLASVIVLNPVEYADGTLWKLSVITQDAPRPAASIVVDLEECLAVLPVLLSETDILHVHHLQGWPTRLLELLFSTDHPKRVITLHDFLAICPSPNMLNGSHSYCGVEPDEQTCNRCYFEAHDGTEAGIVAYTSTWLTYLQNFDEILFPSEVAREIFRKGIGRWGMGEELHDRLHVFPNPLTWSNELAPPASPDPKRVVFLGGFSRHKGAHLLSSALPSLQKLDYRIEIWGALAKRTGRVTVRKYRGRQDLAALQTQFPASIIVLPSIWPETFGFTAHEAVAMLGRPIVVGPYGHPANLVRKFGCGEVMEEPTVQALIASIRKVLNRLEAYEAAAEHARTVLLKASAGSIEELKRLYGLENTESAGAPRYFPSPPSLELARQRVNPNERRNMARAAYMRALKSDHSIKGRIKRATLLTLYGVGPLRPLMRRLARLRYGFDE